MVLHKSSGDGAKASATKTSTARRRVGNASSALAAGLREAQQERAANPLDALEDSDEEENPLCAACTTGRANAVRRVLATAGDVDAVGSERTTPLFIACQGGNADIAALLLEAKADPRKACFGGATPLYIACSRDHSDIVKLLVRAGAPVDEANGYYTPLLAAVTHGCESSARELIRANADVHHSSSKWGTYLHAAAKAGHGDLAKLLCAFGCSTNAMHEGLTPQQLAEQRNHKEVMLLSSLPSLRVQIEAGLLVLLQGAI